MSRERFEPHKSIGFGYPCGDLGKGYLLLSGPHDLKNRWDWESKVPHHPVLNPKKLDEARNLLNGAP